jgi:hypothetical protein
MYLCSNRSIITKKQFRTEEKVDLTLREARSAYNLEQKKKVIT